MRKRTSSGGAGFKANQPKAKGRIIKMKKPENSKLLLKILSGVIAVVLWFAITYTEDPAISQTLTGVDIEIKGEDILNSNGFAIVNRDKLPSIGVVMRGSRSNVISALGEISASVDVSSIKRAGTNTLAVSYSYPTGSIVLEKIKVKEVEIETEVLVSRDVPLSIEVTNRDKNSEHIVKAVSKSETVTVSGAESTVYEVAYAKAKVDASKISKASTQECLYDFYNEKDELVSEQNLVGNARRTVTVESTVYEKVSLPVKVVLDEESRHDYGIIVKNIDKLTVDAGLDDGAEIDFVEAVVTPQKEKTSYETELVVPEGVYIAEENRKITVTGEILPKELKEVTVTVEAENVPDGKRAVISPKEKTITLKTVENISETDIKAKVDMSVLSEAEGILPIIIETDIDADVIGTYSVMAKTETGE